MRWVGGGSFTFFCLSMKLAKKQNVPLEALAYDGTFLICR